MELKYPVVLFIGLIVVFILIIIRWAKNRKYNSGKKIANLDYLKDNDLYKRLVRKNKIYGLIVKIACIVCIVSCLFLLAKPIRIDKFIPEEYNRDIYLCMDVSISVVEQDKDIVSSIKQIVEGLKGERFGICIFNTTCVLLVPLTDDYNYVLETLDKLENGFEYYLDGSSSSEGYEDFIYTFEGTMEENERGASLIGEGLLTCIYNFPEGEENRTKNIILSTDNEVNGTPLIELDKACQIAAKNNIRVYGIGTSEIDKKYEKEMQESMEITKGKYYRSGTKNAMNNIINDIESQQKQLLNGKTEIREVDVPTLFVLILTIGFVIMIVIDKKVSSK